MMTTHDEAKTQHQHAVNHTTAKKFQPVELPPPHTDPDAIPMSTRHVKDATVIVVTDAKYRGATFDGAFELIEGKKLQFWRNGTVRAEVNVKWYDWVPESNYPRIAFLKDNFKILEHYTGEVIDGLGRPI
jgi:hypothetical protein